MNVHLGTCAVCHAERHARRARVDRIRHAVFPWLVTLTAVLVLGLLEGWLGR